MKDSEAIVTRLARTTIDIIRCAAITNGHLDSSMRRQCNQDKPHQQQWSFLDLEFPFLFKSQVMIIKANLS